MPLTCNRLWELDLHRLVPDRDNVIKIQRTMPGSAEVVTSEELSENRRFLGLFMNTKPPMTAATTVEDLAR